MSKFKTIVENILKEWDTPEELKYAAKHPNDHTGDNEIEWTFNLPLSNELATLIVSHNLVGMEDLQDDAGNLLPSYELDGKAEYNVTGYPDDEEIEVTNIYLDTLDGGRGKNYVDITSMLPKEYLFKVAQDLENSGQVELNSVDPTIEWSRDYYNNLL